MQEDRVDKVTDVLFDFCSEQFIKPAGTQLVNKLMNCLLIVLGQSEGEMDVDVNVCIVFGRTFLNRGVVVHNVF